MPAFAAANPYIFAAIADKGNPEAEDAGEEKQNNGPGIGCASRSHGNLINSSI